MTQHTIKLQVALAHAGVASRRAAEQLIVDGKVQVNGHPAHLGQRVTPSVDVIRVNGSILQQTERLRYFLVYKPVGYLSTVQDELNRKTVTGLVPHVSERLYPVGRLDKDSEGLMLLTNDGDLAYTITHPKFNVPKIYKVTVAGHPTQKALDHLKRGVKLKEGYTKPTEIEVIDETADDTTLRITITQGYNRQVRRMLERVGYETVQLIRTAIANLTLETLGNKRAIELSVDQIASLKTSIVTQ